MNCKPGELCHVVGNTDTDFSGIAGRFVTVKELVRNTRLEVSWSYEGPPMVSTIGIHIQCIPDAWLRPIRDPGDDAMDEVVRKVGLPTTDEVPA